MKKELVVLIIVMLATALLCMSLLAQTEGRKISLVTREVSLGRMQSGIVVGTLVVSPDSQRVAYVAQLDDKQLVVVDQVEGKEYDGILKGTPLFSPDSKHVAYAAKHGGKWFVVVDGEEKKEYDGIAESSLIFSPDSKHLAYAVMSGGKWFVVVDGEEKKEYDGIGKGTLQFSPDSKRVVYVVPGRGYRKDPYPGYLGRRIRKGLVVIDGKEGKEYDDIGSNIWVALIDGPLAFVMVGNLLFSPDSKHLAYAAMSGDNLFVVVDGEEGKEYGGVDGPIFSMDSKRVAYIARRDGKNFVVVDGVEGTKYDAFLDSKFVFDSPKLLHALALRNNEIFRVEVEIVEE